MTVALSDPQGELALQRLTTLVTGILDANGAVLFKTVGRGYPIKPAYTETELPGAWVNPVDLRVANPGFEERVCEDDLMGVMILARGEGDTDAAKMTDLSTTLMRLAAAVRKKIEDGTQTLGGLTNEVNYVRTMTPMVAQNLPFNSTMVVFRVGFSTPRNDPFAT